MGITRCHTGTFTVFLYQNRKATCHCPEQSHPLQHCDSFILCLCQANDTFHTKPPETCFLFYDQIYSISTQVILSHSGDFERSQQQGCRITLRHRSGKAHFRCADHIRPIMSISIARAITNMRTRTQAAFLLTGCNRQETLSELGIGT